MDATVAEAKEHFPELLRSVEAGEHVLITRNGEPVAHLVPAAPAGRAVRFGTVRSQIRFKPGWDEPIDEDRFLAGEF